MSAGLPTRWLWLAACLALALPAVAVASPFEVYGFGSRATAMGGAQGAAARDHPAIFYNPANLTLRNKTHFGISLTYIATSLHVTPNTPDGEHAARLPGNNVSFTLGFNFPLGGLLDYRLAFGFALTVPLLELTRLEAVDPARPYFYLYQSLADNLIIAPALGVRIMDWLRAGVGLQILASLGADFQVTGDLVRRRIERRSLTVQLDGAVAPIFGLWSALGPLQVGLTYRGALDLSYHIPVDVLVEDIGTITLDVSGTTLYSPRQVNLGLAWTDDDLGLTLAADATLALWSQAPSPAARIDAVITDEELRPDEDTIGTLFELHTPPFALGAQDVIIPRFGVEWQPNEWLALRAGFFHRPTPIPDQTGYGNVVDASANVLSLGTGFTFADPLQARDEPIHIDLHVQWTHLDDRTTTKDPQAGATFDGSYVSGGNIFNTGLELRHDF